MEITEIKISDDCIACGNCESVCPEVFKVNEKSEVIQKLISKNIIMKLELQQENAL